MKVCAQCGRELEPARAAEATSCPECEAAGKQSPSPPSADAADLPSAPSSAGPVLKPRRPVPVTLVLVGMCVLVFVGMVMKGASLTQPTPEQLLAWGANFGPLTLTGQWWRLATAMFVHIGIVHLALNMWCLWDLGLLAEYLYGPRTYLALYLMSGLAASIVSLARNPLVVTAGASGAIFGLAGALIATMYLGKLPAPRGALRTSLLSLLAFAGYNLAYGFFKGGIDNGAHIGGLVSGLLLGAVLSRDFPRQAPRTSRLRPLLFPLFAVVLAAGIVGVHYVHTPVIRLHDAEQNLRRGNTATALSELNRVVKERPQYAAAWAMLGTIYAQNHQDDQAEAAFRRAAELQPDSSAPWKQLGFFYLRGKRYEAAQAVYEHLATMNPRDVDAQLKLGYIAGELGHNEAAAANFRNATTLAPNLPLAWFNLGLSSMNLKRYDDAVAAFSRVTKLAPKDAEAWIWLANAYQAKGMTDEADAAYLTGYRLKTQTRRR